MLEETFVERLWKTMRYLTENSWLMSLEWINKVKEDRKQHANKICSFPCLLNCLKDSGYYVYHLFYHKNILHLVRKEYLWLSFGSYNKQ
jgi:hypothetical protein